MFSHFLDLYLCKNILFLKADLSFRRINKLAIPALIAGIAEPLLSITDTAIIGNIPSESVGGYVVGYELLPINGLLTFIGLVLIRRK